MSSTAASTAAGAPGAAPAPTRPIVRKVYYSLPLEAGPKDEVGHRLGINAITPAPMGTAARTALLSGGRDGTIIGWDVRAARLLTASADDAAPRPRATMVLRGHMDWINALVAPALPSHIPTLVSASNDRSVRLWRLASAPDYGDMNDDEDADGDALAPPPVITAATSTVLGHHNDYVKCLAYAPGPQWVASGGLDRRIALWDMKADIGAPVSWLSLPDATPKQSIYALATHPSGSLIASGSPDKLIRLWDARSGRKAGQLLGHSDHVRSLLISDDGRLLLSASSDTTVKLWSLHTNRCLATFAHHQDSVWTLCGAPDTAFYSAGKDGVVFRTDTRHPGTADGLGSRALFCEDSVGGVHSVLAHDGIVYAATAASRLRGWRDVEPGELRPKSYDMDPIASDDDETNGESGDLVHPMSPKSPTAVGFDLARKPVIHRTATAGGASAAAAAPSSLLAFPPMALTQDPADLAPWSTSATPPVLRKDALVEFPGQHGLIKHCMLTNKRHVLTLDSAGNVDLWDIVRCVRIMSYGRVDFQTTIAEINQPEFAINWCTVDTKIGTLSVLLSETRCFDADMYVDEAGVDGVTYQPDQRTNLGRWVLVSLFRHMAAVIDAERTRQTAVPPVPPVPNGTGAPQAADPPSGEYNAPPADTDHDDDTCDRDSDTKDSESTTGGSVARGRGMSRSTSSPSMVDASGEPVPRRQRSRSQSLVSRLRRLSLKHLGRVHLDDQPPPAVPPTPTAATSTAAAGSSGESVKSAISGVSNPVPGAATNDASSAAGSDSPTTAAAPAAVPTPAATMTAPSSTAPPGPPPPPGPIAIPDNTVLAITEEESADACSSAARWVGTVGSTARDRSAIDAVSPTWLRNVLYDDIIPLRDPVKIGFVLTAMPGSGLPELRAPNSRLLAHRLVRVRRILAYIVENSSIVVPDGVAVEDYLQLLFQGQPLNPLSTLATVRTYLWRAGADGDMLAQYRIHPNAAEAVAAVDGARSVNGSSSAAETSGSDATAPSAVGSEA
ncbi:hypothetical protein AMAG_00869 [Allomyces macrogynus ATCC 38327]|uniref:Uncharacterized protein n=1 Tax=Allomyces macrogynus (strain ATCC 38327) TaxID=578462 RepID=A0A0L0RXZ2_ALLM3|nr:hypothetical protein AMAG_00869 [Allomyces macrogynus ATCC 38327]|eukprot:KNE54926.1 hypothetical protein AMAG_00869 [Allomyces macrogynus ATCC 38327]